MIKIGENVDIQSIECGELNKYKTSVSGRNPMRIYSHRTIKSLMDRPRFAQHKFEGWA